MEPRVRWEMGNRADLRLDGGDISVENILGREENTNHRDPYYELQGRAAAGSLGLHLKNDSPPKRSTATRYDEFDPRASTPLRNVPQRENKPDDKRPSSSSENMKKTSNLLPNPMDTSPSTNPNVTYSDYSRPGPSEQTSIPSIPFTKPGTTDPKPILDTSSANQKNADALAAREESRRAQLQADLDRVRREKEELDRLNRLEKEELERAALKAQRERAEAEKKERERKEEARRADEEERERKEMEEVRVREEKKKEEKLDLIENDPLMRKYVELVKEKRAQVGNICIL